MGPYVHYTLTRAWAEEEGFTPEEAEEIARFDIAVDERFRGGLNIPNKRYHLGLFGAHHTSDAYLRRAIEDGSLAHLGMALHAKQDGISHGWIGPFLHYPGIDVWEKRSVVVQARIEEGSRAILRAYRGGRLPQLGRRAARMQTPLEPPGFA